MYLNGHGIEYKMNLLYLIQSCDVIGHVLRYLKSGFEGKPNNLILIFNEGFAIGI